MQCSSCSRTGWFAKLSWTIRTRTGRSEVHLHRHWNVCGTKRHMLEPALENTAVRNSLGDDGRCEEVGDSCARHGQRWESGMRYGEAVRRMEVHVTQTISLRRR